MERTVTGVSANGREYDDGELLMQPTGACYMLHVDADGALGEIDKWSWVSSTLTRHYSGSLDGALELWERLRAVCFVPSARHLRRSNVPMTWFPHATTSHERSGYR